MLFLGGNIDRRIVRAGRDRSSEVKKLILGLAMIVATGVAIPANAQSINQREHRQEQRIRQGERNGQLTRAEARRLQLREMRLHRTEARMRSRNGGHLSHHQRSRLRHMANRDSAAIHQLRHNRRHY